MRETREGQASDAPSTDARVGAFQPTAVGSVGVVVYTASANDSERFDATWYSTASLDQRKGSGVGRGDVTSGFAGTYEGSKDVLQVPALPPPL